MSKVSYPTGVENHGGSLRIWFNYKGKRVRENLGIPDTARNRKVACDLRTSVCFSIRMGSFDYVAQFPNSPNLKLFGLGKKDITVKELAVKWLELKKMEITANTMGRYQSVIKNCLQLLGGRKLAASVTQENALVFRKELLTGYHLSKKNQIMPIQGRSVPTVNTYMTVISGMFQFAVNNGYIVKNPFEGLPSLKKAKVEPDPLSREEFNRLIEACYHQQTKNFWSLAVYTGMRHGELCGLAWEDIDLRAGTLTVRRNYTQMKEFNLPKTDAGTDRVIQLTQPAINVLRNQAELTRLGQPQQIEVKLREYGRASTHSCSFVFNPQITDCTKRSGFHYAVSSINRTWESAIKRAGIRHRKAYQSRHTYACWSLAAGANPNFIANQMGHANAQMVYNVYGAWMSDNNQSQITLLNQNLCENVPSVPHKLRKI
ncbi:phage integrase [Trabulsiella guamensis ATCC 49490]|uniref:Phage integrase n=1 Tax=Trabulsiella guamensis ATCC 49490 TaxID=1005994 RepID=A0A085A9Q0_9ENTR|nr:site-specific integrase [Trabulsiella guamensis]KFC06945.1 phage integrase [Trabulsiella guamensis ATCC 49490]